MYYLPRAFASYIGPDFCYQWYLNRKFTMVMSALLLIVPSCLKRIDGMEFMGYIGVASMIYLVIVIVLGLFIGDYPKGEVNISNINVWKFFNVVPTISFAYQCHVSSVPIMSCVYNRNRSTILKACLSAMSICLVVYTLCANCGYLTFGSLVNPDVLLDYDAIAIGRYMCRITLRTQSLDDVPHSSFLC
ncbi:putative sodium-coupled neutral amino acid transporter 7 [Armadillidium vulgare]|nr:putative sodium-coupled neutral amino acid transporter 7 [Armadillidium vulgare]